MSGFVLDASIALAWAFEDEADDVYAQRVLRSLTEEQPAYVPHVWDFEVANSLIVSSRHKRLDPEGAIAFMDRMRDMPIHYGEERPTAERLFDIGRRYGLESYDAAYLLLAIASRLPIATGDAGLRRAARRAHVRIYAP